MAQRLKHLPGMRETWVQSLGWEDPLEKEMAAHSSTLAWRMLWREEPGRLQSMGSQRVGHNWVTSLTSLHNIGAPQYVRQMLTSMKWEINNIPITPMNRSTKQKATRKHKL